MINTVITNDAKRNDIASLTLIIPNYNHGHLIKGQLDSILSQSMQPSRIIIIDDASTDDSVHIIKQYIDGYNNIELVLRDVNGGTNTVLNQGLSIADTEFVTFPAADDILKPLFIEESINTLLKFPESAICSTSSIVKENNHEFLIPRYFHQPCHLNGYITPGEVRKIMSRQDTWIVSNSVIARRKLLLAAGGFNPKLKSWADEFVYRVLSLRYGACFIPKPLAINMRYSDSCSASSTPVDLMDMMVEANNEIKQNYQDIFSEKFLSIFNARLAFGIKLSQMKEMENSLDNANVKLGIIKSLHKLSRPVLFIILRYRDVIPYILSKIIR